MNLSKAFDTLHHDLVISKLYAYGFQHDALKLLHSYLSKNDGTEPKSTRL